MNKYVIVGDGIAGVSAAENIIKYGKSDVTILSKESIPFYNRIQLNDFLSGYITVPDLIIRDIDWYKSKNINLHLQSEVHSVDLSNQVLQTVKGDLYEFDKLLLALGSSPVIPESIGGESQGIFSLRTVEDAQAIKNYIDGVEQVVVVGGGLLGLEAGNSLLRIGKKVVVLEFMDRLLPRQLDTEAARRLTALLNKKGFELRVDVKVKEYRKDSAGAVTKVCLEDGEELDAGMVLLSTGVKPNLELARDLNLTCNRGIVVDSALATSHPNILAAGDCAEHEGRVYGTWMAAMEQGRIAGMQMSGEQVSYHGSVMMNRLKVAGIDLASAGEIDNENNYDSLISENEGHYQKIITKQGILIGCILLGQTGNFGKLSKMIKQRKMVTELFE